MLATDQTSWCWPGHILNILMFWSEIHTHFSSHDQTQSWALAPCGPCLPESGSKGRNHISFFPSIKARNFYHPLFMRCRISSHKSWRNLIYWQKKVHVPKSLSLLSPTSLPCNPSPLLGRSGRGTSLFTLQAKKSGGFLADSTLDLRSSCGGWTKRLMRSSKWW